MALLASAVAGALCGGALTGVGDAMDGLINESELEYLDGRKDAVVDDDDVDVVTAVVGADPDTEDIEAAAEVVAPEAVDADEEEMEDDDFRIGCRASSGVCLSLSMKDSFFGSDVAPSPTCEGGADGGSATLLPRWSLSESRRPRPFCLAATAFASSSDSLERSCSLSINCHTFLFFLFLLLFLLFDFSARRFIVALFPCFLALGFTITSSSSSLSLPVFSLSLAASAMYFDEEEDDGGSADTLCSCCLSPVGAEVG